MSDDATRREERPLSDEERAELYREQLKRLHVIDLVRDMMVTLVTVGYEKLGLTEQTRELRDLTDARVAIESLRRLIEVVEGEGDPEAAGLRSTLAQMQLNYARAVSEAPPSAPPRAEPGQETPSEAETQPRAEDENEPAMAPKAAPKKPTPKKPAAKKPTPKKPAAKKPAAKRSAPKKPPAG